ncbi:MAG: cyclic lactone autoinducer peptide [Lachnospiraceae bacterium]|nr:cyclic lactone autoinducer peptide [Lachnospiraceae bacterium]
MKRKKLFQRLMSAGILNSLALLLVVQSANQACIWFFHQPKFPESGNKFKRH